MNSIPKISIIVPIHNAGEHLRKCLDTLLNQTLLEIEIILVLDRPTDGSDSIAKEYAAKDERIIIIENEENLHVGYARNRGIAVAKGEFISFSDHDDYRDLTMYEKLYENALQNQSEIVLSLPAYVENEKTTVYEFDVDEKTDLKQQILRDLISFGGENPNGAVFILVTNNIYKREFLQSHDIQFVNSAKITPEDVLFQTECIQKSDKISIVNWPLYFHVFHNKNEGRTYSYIGYERRGAGIYHLYDFLKKEEIFKTYKSEFYQAVVKQFTYSLSGALMPNFNILNFIKAAKYLRKFPFTKDAFQSYSMPLNKKGLRNRIFRKMIVSIMKF